MTSTSTMKAIEVHEFIQDFSNVQETMTMNKNADRPTLNKNQMLIKVLACSLSPGDVLKVGGNLIFMHPSKFPFVPGMDVCGTVEDPNGDERFQVGDIVVAADGINSEGGMAQYMAIPKSEAVLKPAKVGVLEAASSSSAITARNAVMDNVKKGDRVLILGGSGGVGTPCIQLAKHHAKASFVATTSTQSTLCQSLGADQVINYRTEHWWDLAAFQEDQFDVIIDTVGGGNFTDKAKKVLKTRKQGGSFIAVTGDDPKPKVDTWWKAIKFMAKMPARPLYTWWNGKRLPKYVALMPYDYPQGRKQVLDMMDDKTLKIPLDQQSPLPFTEEGVKKAFEVVASGHAHGKVVVSME
jgi:NADPH:quinone reductase-like Zn-dependent oxidoreductase